jgi:hypothetical protein
MWYTMCRDGAVAVLVLLGSVGLSQAQPYPYYRGPQPYYPGPQPYQRGWAPRGAADVQGVWYLDGDPNLPCYVEVGPDGYRAFFTNENGDRSAGRILGGGRIVADKWRLPGQVQGDVIEWANGSHWSR